MFDRVLPPVCGRVRLVIAGIILAVAIPRLPFVSGWPYAQLGLLDAATYAYGLLPISIALGVTAYRGRLHVVGRLIAVLSFSAMVTLAFATTSVTSMLIDIWLAVMLFVEIIDYNDC